MFDPLDYGAVGDGVHDDAMAIQSALDACASTGGGVVRLSPGKKYLSSPLTLRSNLDFVIENGDWNAYGSYLSGGHEALLNAKDATNIRLLGDGVLDGNSVHFQDVVTDVHVSGIPFPRPSLIRFIGCSAVTIDGPTFTNANAWNIHLAGCEIVLIRGITIRNDLRYANSDGIDPDHCRNVRIVDCDIETADDCIVLKNTRAFAEYGPTENIIVSGCRLTSTSSAFKIGSESVDAFSDIIVDSCVVARTNRAFGIQLRDEGNVENVRFSNCTIRIRRFYDRWWGKAEPIWITAIDRDENTRCGRIRNVFVSGLSCECENGVFICGQPGRPVENVVISDLSLKIVKNSKWDAGIYERRPCAGQGLVRRPSAGIFASCVDSLTLRNVAISWAEDIPEGYGAALETMSVEDLVVEDFLGIGAKPGHEAIVDHGLGAAL